MQTNHANSQQPDNDKWFFLFLTFLFLTVCIVCYTVLKLMGKA